MPQREGEGGVVLQAVISTQQAMDGGQGQRGSAAVFPALLYSESTSCETDDGWIIQMDNSLWIMFSLQWLLSEYRFQTSWTN